MKQRRIKLLLGVAACADFLKTTGQRFNPSVIKVLQLKHVARQFQTEYHLTTLPSGYMRILCK